MTIPGAATGFQTPRDAATVILARDGGAGQYEVFLMRRHQNQAFLGGAHVFPGGRLDESDCDPELFRHTRGLSEPESSRLLQEDGIPGARAVGLFLAAIRETLEEAGVLLACGGAEVGHVGAERLMYYRHALHRREITLREMAEREKLVFDLELLTPFAHWITPEIESKRFNTRFFVARLPEGQTPVHDNMELTESRWMTPTEAMERHEAGEIVLMPPTLKNMEELSVHRTVAELFAAARSRSIPTVLPQLFNADEEYGIKLPHDPEYTIAAYKCAPRPGETSRVVMQNGTWRCCAC
jgi:8-oxo-dGTP pyrophosphatase MutT (NUDIX family)